MFADESCLQCRITLRHNAGLLYDAMQDYSTMQVEAWGSQGQSSWDAQGHDTFQTSASEETGLY